MKKIFLGLFFVGTVASCNKKVPGNTKDDGGFDAYLVKDTISAGDTASFVFSENPDFISFWSGEFGHEYQFRNRTLYEGGRLKMKFESRVQNRSADTLDLYVSQDFSGIYDSSNVAAATWKPLNSLFNFPLPAATTGIFYPSGATSADFADISDSVVRGRPFYIAFRYNKFKVTNIIWTIAKLGLYNTFYSNIPTVTVFDSTDITSGRFNRVQMMDNVQRWATTTSLLKCTNSTSAPLNAQYWYISGGFQPNAASPDLPFVIKNIAANTLTSYQYRFTKPGVYKITFVASYARLNYTKEYVKELTLVVR